MPSITVIVVTGPVFDLREVLLALLLAGDLVAVAGVFSAGFFLGVGAFLATVLCVAATAGFFFTTGFFTTAFFTTGFFATRFFAGAFFSAVFLPTGFLLAVFFVAVFSLDVDFFLVAIQLSSRNNRRLLSRKQGAMQAKRWIDAHVQPPYKAAKC